MDWITGEKFQNVGDFTFAPPNKVGGDYNSLPNTFNKDLVKDGSVIYTHSMYTHELLKEIKQLSKKVTIITHNCDWNIDSSFPVPENIIKWYGQNIDVVNPKIESIPIGLENPWWFVKERKKEKMIAMSETPKDIRKIVYVNHNISTNPLQRQEAYEHFQNKPFATVEHGLNGQGFNNYLDNIYHHKFVVCPAGNGIDTHRTWETLYMGSIPIEIRNINNQFYTDLPICFIDDWGEITEDFLNKEYARISNTDWNVGKLKFGYWKNKIMNQDEIN